MFLLQLLQKQEGGDMEIYVYIYIADFLCDTTETNKPL